MKYYRQPYPVTVNVQDWSQWPYVQRTGYPNVAQHWPYGYPTLAQTDAYRVLGPPPRPRKVNHALHAVATFLTAGFWIPVWLTVTAVTHVRNSRADADYWFRIQRYRQWELGQQSSASIPPQRALGG